MSLSLAKSAVRIEQADELHLVRMLILLNAATKTKKVNQKPKTVQGITKLAKLDFLLRYPNCLERILTHLNRDASQANVQDYERNSVESSMIRFRYGPWDERYRRWIGLLVARGLAITFVERNTVHVGITEVGRFIADDLANQPEFSDYVDRSSVLVKVVGNYSATKLKDFVYEVFPEISSMRWGEEINL